MTDTLESGCLERGKNSRIGLVKMRKSPFRGAVGNFVAGWLKFKPVKTDALTDEEYDLTRPGFANCRILRTPEYTPGSSCVVIDAEIVHTGDAMIGISGETLPWYFTSTSELMKRR